MNSHHGVSDIYFDTLAMRNVNWRKRGDVARHEVQCTDKQGLRELERDWW